MSETKTKVELRTPPHPLEVALKKPSKKQLAAMGAQRMNMVVNQGRNNLSHINNNPVDKVKPGEDSASTVPTVETESSSKPDSGFIIPQDSQNFATIEQISVVPIQTETMPESTVDLIIAPPQAPSLASPPVPPVELAPVQPAKLPLEVHVAPTPEPVFTQPAVPVQLAPQVTIPVEPAPVQIVQLTQPQLAQPPLEAALISTPEPDRIQPALVQPAVPVTTPVEPAPVQPVQPPVETSVINIDEKPDPRQARSKMLDELTAQQPRVTKLQCIVPWRRKPIISTMKTEFTALTKYYAGNNISFYGVLGMLALEICHDAIQEEFRDKLLELEELLKNLPLDKNRERLIYREFTKIIAKKFNIDPEKYLEESELL